MLHLLSTRGEAVLAAVMRRRPLLAFDFDGTLAPIVARPGDAKVAVAVARRLQRLAAALPVAVVSGRSVADLAAHLPFRPRFLVGNHGAEIGGDALPGDGATGPLDPLRARLRLQAGRLREAGVDVEDKRLSIALHYRRARDRQLARDEVAQLLQAPDDGVRAFGGKCVVNVVPRHVPGPADALQRLLHQCGAEAVVYIGSDVNDEPVFERAPPHWLTVRIGRDDRHSRARCFLDSPAELGIALDAMVACLEGRA